MSIFQDVLVKKPGRSLFNLSHERKFSANFGVLYPFLVIDTVPGDTFKLGAEVFVRAAPLLAPLMHRVNVKLNYFFIPHRLDWEDWESFITGVDQQANPTNPNETYFVNPVKPYVSLSTINSDQKEDLLRDGTLADFLGFPTLRPNENLSVLATQNIDMLPFLAYHRIYMDWFRNQNVEGGYVGKFSSGEMSDYENYMVLRNRCWEKDYFTSCLPWAQRGDPVNIPISTSQSIVYDKSGKTYIRNSGGIGTQVAGVKSSAAGELQASTGLEVNLDNSDNLKIANTAIGTINDLRIATRIQRWLEKNARVGGRYIEQLLGHFGVKSSDARLQRAEYLGGYTLPLVVSDVEQTSNTAGGDLIDGDTPLGSLAGKGTAYGKSSAIKCYCEEFGYLMGIISILPRTSYQDGWPRMYKRSTRYDYYFPEFAHLGEQTVTKDELYYGLANGEVSQDVFGYQERYCEYKYIPSTCHGEFKNNLNFYHLGRRFSSQPALNSTFVRCFNDNSNNRIFAVTDPDVVDHFYVELFNDVKAMRPMPKQAIPTL